MKAGPAAGVFPLESGSEVRGAAAVYQMIGLLGSGGDGWAYLAVRRDLADTPNTPETPAVEGGRGGHAAAVHGTMRLCALKLAADDQAAERLAAEAGLLSSLHHPGVPQPLELFQWQGLTCLATEHRPGRTLDDVQRQAGGPLPPQDVVAWAIQACDILSYLHGQPSPVVHRDLKPANLLLGDDGAILLLDFGASRRYDTRKAFDTVAIGSPEFAAPEQFQGGSQSDPRTDIWGLGASCFHLLTARGPDRLFTFPPLRDVLPSLPQSLANVLSHALQYEADRRFPSALAMRLALEQAEAELQAAAGASVQIGGAVPANRAATARMPLAETGRNPLAGAARNPLSESAAPPPEFARLRPPRPRVAGRSDRDRFVLTASLLSPLVSSLIVAVTMYLAVATRGPFGLTTRPLAGGPEGYDAGVVETGLGDLVVSTVPAGAAVALDGRPLQTKTPLRLSWLAAGNHTVRLSLPGFATEERAAEVKPGVAEEVSVAFVPLVQISLGLSDEDGGWSELGDHALNGEGAGRVAVRLTPDGLKLPPESTGVTLQVVLRAPDGAPLTLFSGPYRWGQARPLRPGNLSPGTYTVEATVLGADLPPISLTAPLNVAPAN